VLRRLLSDHVAANHLSASGYADTHPIVKNDSTSHRARNRRVEIVVLAGDDATTGTQSVAAGPAVNPAVGAALGPPAGVGVGSVTR
jgi:hypothetical protein